MGHDAHVLVTQLPLTESGDQWLSSLCHELFHLWNPTMVGFDSREMWYSEGFTDYWTHRLLARSGQITGSRFLEHVRDWATDYLGEEDERGLRAAGELGSKNRTLIYQGGGLAALCLDIGIRDASGNKRALDGVMAALYELCAKAGGEIPVAELERLLAKQGGRFLAGFLERHVAGNEPLPLEECLADAGLVFESVTVSIPERGAATRLIQVPGATAMGNGILIQRTSGGTLEPDDLLIEVAGERIGGWDDLCRALGGRAPGDEVSVRVRRQGKDKGFDLQLGGHGEDLPATERHVVRLRPDPKAKKKQRAIRAALFGELE